MNTLIEGLRQIIGQADFVNAEGIVDYSAMCEYFAAVLILCIVVASVFRFLGKVVSR